MILRRLALAGWRSFLEEVSLGPFSEGLNLVYGPNGTGKSTLFEALRLAVFDFHGVSGREIEAVKPWGRELSPRVEVEFSQGGETYRLAKQFLEGAFSRLERLEEGEFRPFMEGRKADAFVRGLFSRSAPGRGLAREEHLGLFQVLWAPQGGLEMDSLAGDLVSTIREALGFQVSLAAGGAVEKEIERRYRTFYTRTGKLKTGKDAPPAVHLRRELAEVEEKLGRAREEHEAYREAARKVEDLRLLGSRAAREAEEVEKEVLQAEERAARFREIEEQLRIARAGAEAAKTRLQEARNALRRVEEGEREAGGIEEEIRRAEKDLEAAREEAARRGEAVREARRRVEELQEERKAVEALGRRIEKAREFLEVRARLSDLEKRIAKAEEIGGELEEARKARAGLAAPGRETLEEIEDLARRKRELEIRIRASSVRLEIRPVRPLDVEVLRGEDQGAGDPAKGESLEVLGSPEAEVEVSGLGRIRASGPAGEAEDLRKELARVEADLEERTAPFGTKDTRVLRDLLEKARAWEGKAAELEGRLEILLEGRGLDELRAEGAREKARERALLEEFPAWEKEPPDLEGWRLEYERRKSALEEKEARARATLDEAERAHASIRAEVGRLEERIQEKQDSLSRLKARLETEGDRERLREKVKELALEWDRVRAPLEKLEKEKASFSGDPLGEAEKLRLRLEELRRRAGEARDEEKKAEGALRELAARGTYAALAALEEKAAALKRRLAAQEARLEAVKLLYDTVEEFRSSVTRRVAAPVENRASRILERIAGPRTGRVVLDETLAPAAVVPGREGGEVELGNLSGGEREQLHFACRLALAQVLAREERQLLVLDDVLTATDAARFARILGILEEAAGRLQVVILSCHPERYAGLEGLARFDLERAVSNR